LTVAFIGLGANLDNPVSQVQRALDELDRIPGNRVTRRSSLYRTAPVGFAGQPAFINAVARAETTLPPAELLAALQDLEDRHGRTRSFANAPRTLDLDLLLYGDHPIEQPGLKLPHPRMHQRAFVLVPLAEIAADVQVPGQGRVQDLLEIVGQAGVERLNVD